MSLSPEDQAVNNQRTKDEIGEPDNINQVLFFDEIETVGIEPGLMQLSTRVITTDSIWDADNWDEVNWEGDYDNIPVVKRVLNPNNIYIERFFDNLIEDTGNSTATWDEDGEISFSSTSSTVAQSTEIHLNDENITKAIVNVTGTDTDNGDYQLSVDGGLTWATITLGTQHTFVTSGNDLRWKIDNFSEDVDILLTEDDESLSTEDGELLSTEIGDLFTFTITKLQINYEV